MKKQKKTASLKRIEELDLPKTKLQMEHFGIFKYGHTFSISISKKYYNNNTAREDINKICMALFGKVRYTPEMMKALKDSNYL